MTVGFRWTISHLPGEEALPNAARTIASFNFCSPAKTSTAASAVAALLADVHRKVAKIDLRIHHTHL